MKRWPHLRKWMVTLLRKWTNLHLEACCNPRAELFKAQSYEIGPRLKFSACYSKQCLSPVWRNKINSKSCNFRGKGWYQLIGIQAFRQRFIPPFKEAKDKNQSWSRHGHLLTLIDPAEWLIQKYWAVKGGVRRLTSLRVKLIKNNIKSSDVYCVYTSVFNQ